MKRKLFFVCLVLVITMFLVGCGGIPTVPNQAPTASFTATPTSGITPLTVSFNASSSSDSDGNIINYAWDFGDGSNDSGITTIHTYENSGDYTVQLIITDNNSATNSTTNNITVTEAPNQPPTASFTANPTSGIAPLEVAFDASNSSDSDGSIISYAWDFKDGSTGSGQTITHTFSSIGNYDVELTVTDNEGATDSTTKTITVTEPTNQSPIASFTASPTSGVVPLEVSFNASNTSDSDGSIINYQWDFKDGNTGNGKIVNHTFSSIGSYNVKLTVTDNEGATDSTTKTITVTEPPNQSPIASLLPALHQG